MITSPTLAAAFANGMEYFNTYGGNNAAVAAGRAVLKEIQDKQLQQHAADVGRYGTFTRRCKLCSVKPVITETGRLSLSQASKFETCFIKCCFGRNSALTHDIQKAFVLYV